MNSTPVGCASAPATRYVDAASGRKKPEISAGSPSRVRALSIIAGSAASEDRELNATACAGKIARANSPSGTRPPTTASRIQDEHANDTVMPMTVATNPASAPAADAPMRVASGSASAKTPIGASWSTHRTTVSAASPSPWKNATTGVAPLLGQRQQRETEQQREDDQRQQRTIRRRLDRVRGHEIDEPARERRNVARVLRDARCPRSTALACIDGDRGRVERNAIDERRRDERRRTRPR